MTHHPRFALLRIAVLVSLALRCGTGDAVGLGPLRLQSALGQPLRATVPVLGSDAGTLVENCIRISLRMPDGSEIVRPQFELRRGKAATELVISTARTVDEPAVALVVETTCTPTLHRDYQLLLDLRDGLPGVLSNSADDSRQEPLPRSTVSTANDGSTTGSARSKKRSGRSRSGGVRSVAAADLETMPTDDGPKAPPVRAKAAPASRSVLKLTQTDTLQGDAGVTKYKQAAGLKFSQSLAMSGNLTQADNEELSAAKARFQAVLRGEDALVAARKELKALQTRTAPAAANPAPVAAGQPAQAATPQPAAQQPSTPVATPAPPDTQAAAITPVGQGAPVRESATGQPRSVLASTSMMLGIGLLMAAGITMIWRHLRNAGRIGTRTARKNTPWWLSTSDDATREAELLESARSSVSRKEKTKAGAVTAAAATRDYQPDKIVERYVDRFVGQRETPASNIDTRIEPVGLAIAPLDDDTARERAPAQDASTRAGQSDQASTEMTHFDDAAPRDLARTKLATFELVSDVMQEAEFWKMLNETQRAIDILENYCNSAASASPAPWLYLADLYESLGDGERRAQLCTRFREIFNGRLHEADANTPAGRETLEGYPHLMEKISALWGQEEVVPFLQGLLVNDRESPREGFYLPVYQEILLLIDVAMEREQALA